MTISRQFLSERLRQGSASSPLCLYGPSRCHRLSSSSPRRFPQRVERTEYRRPGVPLQSHPLDVHGFLQVRPANSGNPLSVPCVLLHWWSCCTRRTRPSLQTGPLDRSGQANSRRLTADWTKSPLHHHGEDSNPSSERRRPARG